MSDVLLVLPLLIPLTTAAVSLLAWRRMPFVLVVVLAAATTATLRQLGVR